MLKNSLRRVVIKMASNHLDKNVQSVKCIVQWRSRVFVKSANIDNSHALTCPSLRSALFPYHQHSMGTRWVPGGHLVVSASGGTISHYLLARYSTDRGPRACIRTLRRSISSLDLFSFVHLFLISILPPSVSVIFFLGQTILSFSLSLLFSLSHFYSLSSICIDVSRIKKGARDRSPGIIHGDAASDLRASSVTGSRFHTVIDTAY